MLEREQYVHFESYCLDSLIRDYRWIPDPNNPNEKIYNRDPDFIDDHKKAVIQEAQMRSKLMEDMLKERGIEITNSFVEYTEPKKTFKEVIEELKGKRK